MSKTLLMLEYNKKIAGFSSHRWINQALAGLAIARWFIYIDKRGGRIQQFFFPIMTYQLCNESDKQHLPRSRHLLRLLVACVRETQHSLWPVLCFWSWGVGLPAKKRGRVVDSSDRRGKVSCQVYWLLVRENQRSLWPILCSGVEKSS